MAMASASFACTTYLGKLTVTPQGTGSSGSVTDEANGGTMATCVSSVGTAALKAPNPVQVLVAPASSCIGKLPAATYTMSFANGKNADCMYGSSVGSVVVDSNGNGTATSNSISPSVGTFGFCVSNASNFKGLQVKLSAI